MHYLPLIVFVILGICILIPVNIAYNRETTPEQRRPDAMDADGEGTHVW